MRHSSCVMMNWFRSNWLRVVAHAGALLPLAMIIIDNQRYNLTANPILEITLRTGKAGLVLLVLSLACTPLNTVFGFRDALKVRRALGLYGFAYIALHLFIFVVLDYGIDLQLIAQAVIEKYYIIAGFIAFIMLVPLAITSTRGWMKRLGRRWKSLHMLVYLAVPVGVLHFALLVKSVAGRPEPLLWGALVLGLLALRLPPVRKWFANLRGRMRTRAAGEARAGAWQVTTRAPGRLKQSALYCHRVNQRRWMLTSPATLSGRPACRQPSPRLRCCRRQRSHSHW